MLYPSEPNTVYVGDEGWFKSTDGGKTFRSMPVPHGDNHDIWINPKNSEYMIQANDGGANVSLDGGRTWSTQANQPTAEIYQVAVDNQYPYRVYGAQQDNTTVIAPSLALGMGRIFVSAPDARLDQSFRIALTRMWCTGAAKASLAGWT